MPNSLFDLIKKSKDQKDLRHWIPRDEYGNEIKFAEPAPQPYAIPRDQYGNEIKVDPKELIKPLEQAVMERRLNNAKGKEKTMDRMKMQGLLGMAGQPQQMQQPQPMQQLPQRYTYENLMRLPSGEMVIQYMANSSGLPYEEVVNQMRMGNIPEEGMKMLFDQAFKIMSGDEAMKRYFDNQQR